MLLLAFFVRRVSRFSVLLVLAAALTLETSDGISTRLQTPFAVKRPALARRVHGGRDAGPADADEHDARKDPEVPGRLSRDQGADAASANSVRDMATRCTPSRTDKAQACASASCLRTALYL
eukprot:3932440-Rhodomonas_salina.1